MMFPIDHDMKKINGGDKKMGHRGADSRSSVRYSIGHMKRYLFKYISLVFTMIHRESLISSHLTGAIT